MTKRTWSATRLSALVFSTILLVLALPTLAMAWPVGAVVTPLAPSSLAPGGVASYQAVSSTTGGETISRAIFTFPAGTDLVALRASDVMAGLGATVIPITNIGVNLSARTVTVYLPIGTTSPATGTPFSIIISNVTNPGPGTYTYAAQFRNSALVWIYGTSAPYTIGGGGDVTPPFTSLVANPVGPDGTNGWYKTAPSITLTADEPATTYFAWDGPATNTYSAALTAPEGVHTLHYFSVDTATNAETEKTAGFSVDTVAPAAPSVTVGTVTTASVALSWDAIVDSGSGIDRYDIYQDGVLVGTTTGTSYTAVGLDPGTTYDFQVAAVDVAGWDSPPTNTVSATTDSADTTPPLTSVITTPLLPDGGGGWYTALSIPELYALIDFSTDEPAVTYYGWGAPAANPYVTALWMPEGINTLYYYSVDPSNNSETPQSITFKADYSVPTQPIPTVGTVTATSIEFNWNACTDAVSGFSHYEIYLDHVSLGTTTATSYTATGLLPGTTHDFQVVSRDVAGWGWQGPMATGTTEQLTWTLTYNAGPGGAIVGTTPQTVANGGNGELVTATPNPGFVWVSWSDGYPTAARTDLNVTGNITATATFAPVVPGPWTLTYNAGPGGAIVGTTPQTVANGGNGDLVTATPNPGFVWVSWSDGYPTAARTDLNVTGNITATATFAPVVPGPWTITPSAGANGSITPSAPQTVPNGGSTSFAYAPNAGYHVASLTVDGSAVAFNPAGGSYNFVNVLTNHSIGVTFAADGPVEPPVSTPASSPLTLALLACMGLAAIAGTKRVRRSE